MTADDGMFRIQEFRREYDGLRRQLDPPPKIGSLFGRIGRGVNTWLGPLSELSDL